MSDSEAAGKKAEVFVLKEAYVRVGLEALFLELMRTLLDYCKGFPLRWSCIKCLGEKLIDSFMQWPYGDFEYEEAWSYFYAMHGVAEAPGLVDKSTFQHTLNRYMTIIYGAAYHDFPAEELSLEMEKTLQEQPGADEKETPKAKKILEINPDHDVFKALSSLGTDDDAIKEYAPLLYEEAMLLEGYDIKDKGAFVKKLNELMVKALGKKE